MRGGFTAGEMRNCDSLSQYRRATEFSWGE